MQDRALDFEWPYLCKLGSRHGEFSKEQWTLAIHEDYNSISKGWPSKVCINKKKDEVVGVHK